MRGVSEQRRKQLRWFGAEIFVVMVGVLLALGLNAWWQGRVDADRERTYLWQIYTDLEESIVAVETALEINELRMMQADSLVASFSEATTGQDMTRLSRPPVELAAINTGVIKALIQSGDLHLIQNDSLRTKIMTFAE